MILTQEVLEQLGFYTNHPNKVMCKWHKTINVNNDSYEFTLVPHYSVGNTDLEYQLLAKLLNNSNKIKRKIDISYVKTTDELNYIINFCKL